MLRIHSCSSHHPHLFFSGPAGHPRFPWISGEWRRWFHLPILQSQLSLPSPECVRATSCGLSPRTGHLGDTVPEREVRGSWDVNDGDLQCGHSEWAPEHPSPLLRGTREAVRGGGMSASFLQPCNDAPLVARRPTHPSPQGPPDTSSSQQRERVSGETQWDLPQTCMSISFPPHKDPQR